MRILWVDSDNQPWTDETGWKVMEDFGIAVQHIKSIEDAQHWISIKSFDVLFLRREMPGAEGILTIAKEYLRNDPRKIVYASSEWTRGDFKAHAKSKNVADRYARVPMPVEGFLGTLADLFTISINELRGFQIDSNTFSPPSELIIPTQSTPSLGLTSGKSGNLPSFELAANFQLSGTDLKFISEPSLNLQSSEMIPPSTATGRKIEDFSPETKKTSRKPKPTSMGQENPDADLLHKYLKLKEEQLSISETEKRELANENDRIQRESQHLQVKLRELTYLMDETSKKIKIMEKEFEREHSEQSQSERMNLERIRNMESQIKDSQDKYETLRSRVRKDIRKIRSNEKDLEARYELLRKDSETLLHARDIRVLELQRKIDALEYDLDQVQDSRVLAQMESERYLAKLTRIARALNIASALIVEDQNFDQELEDLEPEMGGAAMADEKQENMTDQDSGAPPHDETEEQKISSLDLSPEMLALANDGDPTRIVTIKDTKALEGEPESSSG